METKQLALTLCFAEVVLKHIENSDVTEFSLAEKTGIPRSTLRRSLQGNRQVTLNEVAAIAYALDVTITELMNEAETRLDQNQLHIAA